MKNLQIETLDAIVSEGKTIEDVAYCHIGNIHYRNNKPIVYCHGELKIDSIDIMYDNGYGMQEIEGFIVFNDNTWLERAEYDGSEWWDYKTCPQLKD